MFHYYSCKKLIYVNVKEGLAKQSTHIFTINLTVTKANNIFMNKDLKIIS